MSEALLGGVGMAATRKSGYCRSHEKPCLDVRPFSVVQPSVIDGERPPRVKITQRESFVSVRSGAESFVPPFFDLACHTACWPGSLELSCSRVCTLLLHLFLVTILRVKHNGKCKNVTKCTLLPLAVSARPVDGRLAIREASATQSWMR